MVVQQSPATVPTYVVNGSLALSSTGIKLFSSKNVRVFCVAEDSDSHHPKRAQELTGSIITEGINTESLNGLLSNLSNEVEPCSSNRLWIEVVQSHRGDAATQAANTFAGVLAPQ